MTSPPPPPPPAEGVSPRGPKFGLSANPPGGGKAFAFTVLWVGLALGAAAAAVFVGVDLPISPVLRGVIVFILVLLGVLALMLASESAARWLPGWVLGASGVVQWLTTAFVGLVVVVIVGAILTLAFYKPTNPLLDFAIDAVVGLAAGAIAVGLIIGVGEGGGIVIGRFQGWLRLDGGQRRVAWQPREAGERWRRRELLRGLALGLLGVLLSAVVTALTIPSHPARFGTAAAVEQNLWATVLGPVLVWFAATAVVWGAFLAWRPERVKPHGRLRHGTHASALGLCLAIGALWFVAAGVERNARNGLWSGRPDTTIPTVTVTGSQANLTSPYLAQQFEPQFWLASGEKWWPTSVTWYLQHTHVNKQPPFCNTKYGCREISARCDTSDPPKGCARRGAIAPALYYRYKVLGNDPGDNWPDHPPGTWTVIQYWIFYNYDSLHAGPIRQWHESDWEQISVLALRNHGSVTPVEVAFSEHCYGAVVPAERVRWVSGAGAHPLSFVGLGSHANYPRRVGEPIRELRCSLGVTPRYLGVAGLFFSPAVDGTRLEIPVAYTIGLHDTADGARVLPMQPLLPLDSSVRFQGAWGLDNNLSFYDIGRLHASAGPGEPQRQGPSITPFSSMFCAHSWLGRPSSPPSETGWVCG